MRNTRWIYREHKNFNNLDLNIDRDILKLLPSHLENEEDIINFVYPSLKNIKNPFSLSDVEKAIERILQAHEKNENIWIYGDYDVDGITSSSLAYLALQELGIESNYYIPLRDEGYGLNMDAIKEISDKGGNLIITVDCGISSHKEIDYANSLGIDIIVTDHHEINSGIPNAFAIINPKREDNSYKFKYLAGVGTIFMVMYALFIKLNRENEIFKYIDIVAIGTVADIVPLLEENRIFTKFGLEKLNLSESLGLRMLIKTIFDDYSTRKFSPYDIGFIIAPIFNAAGRLEDAKKAVELFIERDHVKCTTLIGELLKNNKERKEIQENILDTAIDEIEKNKLFENPCIVIAKKDFHHGVIGIVASKIVDKYYKPTIIMSIEDDGKTARASCRSIEGFNMVEALNHLKEYLLKYGGHAGAAGFSIETDKIKDFSERLMEYTGKVVPDSMFIKPIKINIDIPSYKVSYDFLKRMSALEPFGFGNPSPLFLLKDCEISDVRAIGKDKNHTMFNMKKNNIEIRNCVWWNSDDILEKLKTLNRVDIICKLKLETYRDRYQYKIFVEDIQLPSQNENIHDFSLYDTQFPLETVFYTRHKIENDAKLSLDFTKDSLDIINNRRYIGELDSQTTYILKNLKSMYNYDFKISVKDVVLTDSNYNIHIMIHKAYDFKTYSIKPGQMFQDIKNFLVGNFSYNSFQKKVLASVFKDRKNTIAITKKHRGINTIIQTIALFYKNIGKKVLVITDSTLSQKSMDIVEISPEYKKGYDFYISIEKNIETSKPYLIFTENKNFKENNSNNFSLINDEIKIPQNIILVDESKLLTEKNIFSRKMPIIERIQVLNNLKNYTKLYSTEDILLYL